MNRKIIKSTENFFGLGDCEEQHANLQRKWTQRRKRHYHKRYGALVEEDAVDGAMQRGKSSGAGSISSYQSSRHMQADPNLVRTLSRRESVASLAWKKVRKMREEPGVIFFYFCNLKFISVFFFTELSFLSFFHLLLQQGQVTNVYILPRGFLTFPRDHSISSVENWFDLMYLACQF